MEDSLNKNSRNKRKLFSVDGVSKPSGARSGGSIDFKEKSSLKPASSLDNFKKPEGLSRPTQNSLGPSRPRKNFASPEPEKQPKFFKRWRRSFKEYWGALTRRQKTKRIVATILLILLLIFGFLVVKGYINLRKVLSGDGGAAALQENIDPSKLRVEGDGRINILVMGRGGEGHEGADLTDTIILISINPIDKEAGLVSIPRDLYVSVRDQGSMKINQVFYTGKMSVLNRYSSPSDDIRKQANEAGYSLMEDTVESVLGIPVHYHVMVDFKGFEKAINTVGGVDIDAPSKLQEQMLIYGQPYFLDVKKGWQHMDGFKALAYSRSRYTSARGDFDRSERQRRLIVALKEKVFSLGTFSNPVKISQLLDNFGSHVQTNFSIQDLSRLYEISPEIGGDRFTSIGLVDPPHDFLTTADIDGLSVVVPKAGLNNYSKIHYYIRNTLKDSLIKMENANVMILNGTRIPGLATRKAHELRSYGYNVGRVENAPTRDYSRTILVNLRGEDKKYTNRYLELRHKTISIGSVPDSKINTEGADFVIILGNDQGVTQ